MDDSDLDFTDLCSRLLKRKVRKKAGEHEPSKNERDDNSQSKGSVASTSCSRQTKKSTSQAKKRTKKDASSERLAKTKTESRPVLQAVNIPQLTENGTEAQADTQLVTTQTSKANVKEKVLIRMQKFKRVDPQKLQHADSIPTTSTEPECALPPSSPVQNKDLSEDERLALRLQQELDREYEREAQAQRSVVDVDQGGLFFCQLCFRDLSAMTPQLRTQHINRCLDQNESQAAPAPAPAPARSAVPECPICGKGFKSHKSRSTHMKRCSADMGVPPAVLLQALERQASEAVSDRTAAQSKPTGGGPKRRSPSDPSQPARKKSKKKAGPMDEDTMVALALSRSLLDQEVDTERAKAIQVTEVKAAESQTSAGPTLQWAPAAGKGKRRKKGAPAGPPPLLLRQDPQEALRRLQERVSLMLLRSRTPSPPPTPTLAPSTLSSRGPKGKGEGDAPDLLPPAPLWRKSALPAGYEHTATEFYTPELNAYIQPYVSPQSDLPPSTTTPHARSQTAPSTRQLRSAAPPSQAQPCSPPPAADTPTPLLPSQALQDLLELGEKGLNLAAEPHQGTSHAVSPGHISGFTNPDSESNIKPNNTSSLGRLASDLGSMVNNPQLSDVQLQVDSGEVFFAHSFMLYARCPLLAEQVHTSGFGVEEEGMAAAQRVLLGEVPSQAVLVLLQFLYSARCPLTPTLAPHVHELAARFELPELLQECELYLSGLEREAGEAWGDAPAQEPCEGPEEERDDTQAQQHFLELLRSMWSSEEEEDDDEEQKDEGQGDRRGEGERSVRMERPRSEREENGGGGEEECVDEDELDEIYEFAATQRRGSESALRHETESLEEEEEDELMKVADEEGRTWFGVEEERSTESRAVCEREGGEGPVGKSAQETTPAGVGECLPNSHLPDGSSSRHTDSFSPVETHGCVPEEDKMEAEQHPEPVSHADANLDDSFNHLFSQSWGEYAEPSPTPATTTQHQITPRADSLRVIDLSISPTAPVCEPSLPVAGSSPEPTVSRGTQRRRMSPELTTRMSQRFRMSPELTISRGNSQRHTKSPELSISQGSQSHRMSPELPVARQSQSHELSPELPVTHASRRAAVSPELRLARDSRVEALPSSSQGQPSFRSSTSKEVELIVLSDSSNDSVACLTPSPPPPPPPVRTRSPLVLPDDSPGYTCIKDRVTSKDSLSSSRTAQPNKDPRDGQPTASDTVPAKAQVVPPVSGSARVDDPPQDQSLLDGSAELSWLVPATPHISNRSRSCSTQTDSSMRRTRLFPGSSQSSHSSHSSSSCSSVQDHAKAPSAPNSIKCKEEPHTDHQLSNRNPTTSHSTLTKLEGPRQSIAGDESPVFLPPTSLPRRFSSATDVTPRESLRGSSVDSLSSRRFPQPVSSTPLHSGVESLMSSPFLSDSSFLKNQRAEDVRNAPRGSLEISHLQDVSSSSHQKGTHVKDSSKGNNSGSSERTGGVSENCTSGKEKEEDRGAEENRDTKMKETETTRNMGLGEDERELSPERSFSNYDEPLMPFDEPPMAYDDPPMAFDEHPVAYDEPAMAFDEHPVAYDEPPMAYDEPPVAYDEPPMAFDDSWGLGDCSRGSLQKPRFSLRLESSGDTSLSLTQAPTAFPPAQAQHPLPAFASDRTPPAGSPEPQPSTSVLDPKLWDSWAEDEDEEEEAEKEALPLSQRLSAVAPAKRVAQLRTPVASKKAGPLVPITPMPHYSDMDTPDLKNRLNRFGVRALPKRQMVQKLKEIYQYTHQLETSEEEEEVEEAPRPGHRPRPRPRPASPPGRSCAQSLGFKEPKAPPAVSPRKLQLSQDEQEPLPLSQSSTASSTSERSNPELPLSDSDSSSDSEGSITASQAVTRHADKLQAARRFILSDPELYSQVLQYKPLVLSRLQQRLKEAGIRLGAAKLLDFLDAQCITFTTAKPGQKAPSRRRKKKVVAKGGGAGGPGAGAGAGAGVGAAAGGGRGRGAKRRGGAVRGAD
ncbi:hypothetical protein ACEWY4_018000 [Coilia grayii]|uniref:Structure-specific endonuclease subunit SLX4 n=1 Tax=Coilia grayii TaxID=363190 RepID=A0ABD1JJQ1_9TELE